MWHRADLCAVLAVPTRTPTLLADAAVQALAWEDLGDGYWHVTGGKFVLVVLELDVIGPAEGDALLYSLGHGPATGREARRFWAELLGSKEVAMSMQDMEGDEELLQKLAAVLPLEMRLAGLPAEQRLVGIDAAHQVLALSDEVLRGFPEDYVRSLAPDVQAEIRRRLQRREH